MNDHLDQRQIRVTKLETLRGKGINPYPYSFQNSHTLPELLEIGKILVESQEEVSISGRLMALRGKGKAVLQTSSPNISGCKYTSAKMRWERIRSMFLECVTLAISWDCREP